ncbi:asparagine synthetase, partial [Perkinsus olseni]
SYCVGLAGSPDLKAAREVADFLGTFHREFTFTLQDGINALEDVIHHLETFDVTTIRASTPMYLMTRLIKATGSDLVRLTMTYDESNDTLIMSSAGFMSLGLSKGQC